MAKEHDTTQADLLLQIAQTLAAVQAQASGGANVTDALNKITDTLAGVANRTMPENAQAPGISHYSYPEGELAHPKPALKCRMFWVGYPLEADTLRPDEIDALNTLKPGNYRVTKANGTTIPFTVEGKQNEGGQVIELWIQFPCKGDQRQDHRSMVDYCREARGEAVPTAEQLLAELARVKADLAAAHAVIEGA